MSPTTSPADPDRYLGHNDEPDVEAEFPPYDWRAPPPPSTWDRIFRRRSIRSLLPSDRVDGVELWYPTASRSKSMPVRGTYADGYPIGAVVHTTEGYSKKGDENAEDTMDDGKSKGYCYFCISAAGRVYQPAPLNSWGWHCGYTYHPSMGRNLNRRLVGIEVCNAGLMVQTPDGWRPKDFDGSHWRETYTTAELRQTSKVFNVTEAGTYHCMNAAQEDALTTLLIWMHRNNPNVFILDNVVGHDEVAVENDTSMQLGRKQDPGASLSLYMPAYRTKLAQIMQTS